MSGHLSILVVAALVSSASTRAQKLGVGGTGVDEASTITTCPKPLGTIALVEEKAKDDPRLEALPPGIRAMMDMAQAQQGGGGSVDPLPLLKLLAARSRCFVIVDRGAGFEALQRERALAAGPSSTPQTTRWFQSSIFWSPRSSIPMRKADRAAGSVAG